MKTDPTVAGYIFNNRRLLLVKHKKLGLWLPVGGHIEPNEIPDDAMIREAKEEVGLDVRILSEPLHYAGRDEIKQLALPFYANVHRVGDHNHYCYFYLCESDILGFKINLNEIKGARWFNREDAVYYSGKSLVDLAFKKYKEMKNALG